MTEVGPSPGFAITERYVHGPGADEPLVQYDGSDFSTRRFLLADERGSIVAVTDNSGNPVAVNSYDEYGIPASTNQGRFQYTGQAWIPELGMYSYKARIYSPTLGRFLQTDPAGYPDGPNWYAYVNNDPVNARDPSGMDTVCRSTCSGDDGDIILYPPGSSDDGFDGGLSIDFAAELAAQVWAYYNQLQQQYSILTAQTASIASRQSGNGCKAPPISAAERAAAQRGDRSAFWNSRLAAGDPLAGTALGIVNNNTFSGQIANQILQSAVVAHSPTMHWQGVANEMQSIGVDIMRAHVGAIDRFGSPNTSQITDYHRDVFNAHGLPGSTFGGTAIFGSASLTNAITGWAGCRF